MSPIERRSFLASAVFAALFAVAPTFARPAAGPSAADLAGMWRNRDSARAVGRHYLSQAPEEGDARRLMRNLFGDPAGRVMREPDLLRARIAQMRQRDFAIGDTVIVDGWILARTEARLCALAALA